MIPKVTKFQKKTHCPLLFKKIIFYATTKMLDFKFTKQYSMAFSLSSSVVNFKLKVNFIGNV